MLERVAEESLEDQVFAPGGCHVPATVGGSWFASLRLLHIPIAGEEVDPEFIAKRVTDRGHVLLRETATSP